MLGGVIQPTHVNGSTGSGTDLTHRIGDTETIVKVYTVEIGILISNSALQQLYHGEQLLCIFFELIGRENSRYSS